MPVHALSGWAYARSYVPHAGAGPRVAALMPDAPLPPSLPPGQCCGCDAALSLGRAAEKAGPEMGMVR